MSKTVLILWSALSFLVSGIFIFQGLLMFKATGGSATVIISALVVLSYGIITIFLQSQNWAKPSQKYVKFTQYMVGLMFLNQLFYSTTASSGNSPGLAGLAILVMMLATNWLAVKYVAEHKNQA